MASYTLQDLPTKEAHALLLGAVGPRPIALASTMDAEDQPNLSPFSYFNVFSSNPPILVFSPARRVRNNTTKDTLRNAESLQEVVINVVNYDIVQQTSLSSTEYPTGVNEFTKAGLTPVASETVKPFRVKESPAQFECRVNDIVALGPEGGAGNLIICEATRLHLDDAVLDENGKIDMHKIDLVARMGGAYYCRAQGEALFEVEKPLATLGMGVDALPEKIRLSSVLKGNHLGQLGNVEELPPENTVREYAKRENISTLASDEETLHKRAAALLDQGEVDAAWKTLLCSQITL